MFSPTDWIRLIMSALFILPIVTVIRESGYYLAVALLKGKNKNLIIGSGPTLFKMPTVEVRRYFFMFSWMEYDGVKPSNRIWHGFIYAAPILTTAIFAFAANSLVLEGVLPANIFWSTFIFYCFYYMLFDVIPVYLPDGQPTNGRAIFDLMWHGERSDYKKQRLEREAKEEEQQHEGSEEERSSTEAQEETMENRDRDDQERGDHTNPETEEADDTKRSYTEAQEETKENRDRDEKERGDHTDPES